jgi:hypothetical protein
MERESLQKKVLFTLRLVGIFVTLLREWLSYNTQIPEPLLRKTPHKYNSSSPLPPPKKYTKNAVSTSCLKF